MKKFAAALAMCIAVASTVRAADYVVGVAVVDITPSTCHALFGYPGEWRLGNGGPYSDGLGLTIRAVYIANADGSNPVVLAAADLVNIAPFDTDYARDPDNYDPPIPNLSRDRIMINVTHTHSAPSSSDSSVRVMDEWTKTDAAPDSVWRAQTLRPKLKEAIALAYANREPANLWFRRAKANIGYNRRIGDGPSPVNTTDLTDASGTALNDPNGYDHTLDLIEATRDDGSRKAVLFFYGAHPVALNSVTMPAPAGCVAPTTCTGTASAYTCQWWDHPDYPGFARKTIEDATTTNDIAIFFQAAGGDVNAADRTGYSSAQTLGNSLGQTVLDALSQSGNRIAPSQGPITAFSRVWAAPLETAAGLDHLGGGPREPVGLEAPAPAAGQPAAQFWLYWATLYCEGLTGHGGGNPVCSPKIGSTPDTSWDIEMQTITIGNWRVAGLSHEPVGRQGLKMRQQWPTNWVSVMGYLQRTQNYLPVSAQIDADTATAKNGTEATQTYEGYKAEIWNGHPAPWATYAQTAGRYDIDAEITHVLREIPPARVNYALAWNGSTATASSTLDANRPASAAINGDRAGNHWGSDPSTGSGWHSSTADHFPESLEVNFNAPRTIDTINVFSVQDTYWVPSDPTPSMTFTAYGLVNFTVETWNGSAYVAVKNGTVTNNNKVWVQLTFAPLTTTKIRVTVNLGAGSYARIAEVEAWGDATSRPNVALASNGASATASSTLDANRTAAAAINGDTLGLHWGSDPSTGSGWHSAVAGHFPESLEVDFAGPRTINEIDVFSVQDNNSAPVAPTPTMTFTNYGLIDFTLEYWNGSAWAAIPGGSVTGNNLVWRKVTFLPITTSQIRLTVTYGAGSYARVVELQALTPYDFLSSVPQ